MTDPVADLLTRTRNALMAKKTKVRIPHSIFLENLVEKISQLNYIDSFIILEDDHKYIEITLLYKNSQPVITNLKRVSTPGRRVYVRADKIPSPLSGYGSVIISSSKGVLTGKEAKAQGVGGEVICQIW